MKLRTEDIPSRTGTRRNNSDGAVLVVDGKVDFVGVHRGVLHYGLKFHVSLTLQTDRFTTPW
jgi:hypothetical protein